MNAAQHLRRAKTHNIIAASKYGHELSLRCQLHYIISGLLENNYVTEKNLQRNSYLMEQFKAQRLLYIPHA
jgi:hypothetical protein